MARSVATFFVPGWTLQQVLGLAPTVGASHGMTVQTASANGVMMARGDEFWTGRAVLSVVAFPAEGGTNVEVSGWLEAGVQVNMKPSRFLQNSPKNRLWRASADLVSRLGANPDAVFVHQ